MREWRGDLGSEKEKKTEGVDDILSASEQNKQSASEHVGQKEEGDLWKSTGKGRQNLLVEKKREGKDRKSQWEAEENEERASNQERSLGLLWSVRKDGGRNGRKVDEIKQRRTRNWSLTARVTSDGGKEETKLGRETSINHILDL